MTVELIDGSCGIIHPREVVGGKARGLLRIIELLSELKKEFEFYFPEGIDVPGFYMVPIGYDMSLSDAVLRQADALETDRYAVRSSSYWEDGREHSCDGVFLSLLDVERGNLIEAIRQVQASATGEDAQQYQRDFDVTFDNRMAVIVQKMVDGQLGVIYSKFSSVLNITRVVKQLERGGINLAVLRRFSGPGFLNVGDMLGGDYDFLPDASNLAGISYFLENNLGAPQRVEFMLTSRGSGKQGLSLLQSRHIVGDLDGKLEDDNEDPNSYKFIISSYEVNGVGRVILPVVCIGKQGSEPPLENISYEAVRKLDSQYPDGYILVCNYLEFEGKKYDSVTPNKKALVVTGPSMGLEDHSFDIARQKGLLALRVDGLHSLLYDLDYPEDNVLNTGDLAMLKGDGIEGKLYKAITQE